MQKDNIRNSKNELGSEDQGFFQGSILRGRAKKIVRMTGKGPSELLRKRDKMYKKLDLENAKKSDSQIIKLMIKHPGLILRPIVITKSRALVGRIDKNNLG